MATQHTIFFHLSAVCIHMPEVLIHVCFYISRPQWRWRHLQSQQAPFHNHSDFLVMFALSSHLPLLTLGSHLSGFWFHNVISRMSYKWNHTQQSVLLVSIGWWGLNFGDIGYCSKWLQHNLVLTIILGFFSRLLLLFLFFFLYLPPIL